MQFLKRPQPDHARDGARQVLAGMREIPAVQVALCKIESGIQLDSVALALGTSLRRWLNDQQERERQLIRELADERLQRINYESWYQEQKTAPLLQQLDKARVEVAEAQTRRKAAEEARQRYLQALEQRRLEIQQLQQQIVELNRVIARQHDKLQDLLGPEQP